LKRERDDSWNLFVTFFDADWNRFSRDRVSFRPDSLSIIHKLNGRYLVLHFAIEILPRELSSTCVLELVIDKPLSKGTYRYPLLIRDLFGRSLKMSSVMLTIPGEDRSCSDVLDPIPSYQRNSALCLVYEVYNLKLDANNQSRYRLTYAIQNPGPGDENESASIHKTLSYMWSSVKGKKSDEKPYIESSIEQRAQASVVSDKLQIDIASLEAGTYLLAVRVEDLTTGMAVDQSRLFTVSEGKE